MGWRTIALLVVTLGVEWQLNRLAAAGPVWAEFVRPIQVLLALPAVAALWRVVRPRGGADRRRGERRGRDRRGGGA